MVASSLPDVVVEVDSLVKRYEGISALSDVSVSINRGGIYGLVGSNGAGKTTLLRILLGLTKPTAGRVRVLGQDLPGHSVEVRRRVGYVAENQDLYSWMTAESLLRFVRPMYPTWNDKLCSELLDLFSINAFQRIKHLSKGTVVKLSLIIAVAHEPPLLILDEPTTGLDPLVRTEFLSAIKKRHRTSEQTILMSSHILSDIEALGAEVGILHAGHLLASGSITKLQGTVRVIGVLLPTGLESVALPRNTLWHSRQGEEFWLAVTAFDEPMLEDFTTKNRLKVIAVRGASLEELYLYYVREAGHHDNNAAVERPSS